MMNEHEICTIVRRLDNGQLRLWIREDWVRPARGADGWHFNEADLARVRLIDTLANDLEVGAEAMPVILSLIDQLHALRARMELLSKGVDRQPAETRRALLAEVERLCGVDGG